MIPSGQTLWMAIGWCLLGVPAAVRPEWVSYWLWAGAAVVVVLVLDALWGRWQATPVLKRRLPGRFAVGGAGEVRLSIENRARRAMRVSLFDGVPDIAETDDLPMEARLPRRRRVELSYQVVMLRRGPAVFGPCHLRRASPFGFWWLAKKLGESATVKVYPDYEPAVRLALLAMDHRAEPMGIHRRNRTGMSREFHQLREFHEGDSLAQVDWKASSRHRQLISREFEEQRNQTVVFLFDTGRRMRALDGRLPQFDHCLNAALLVSYVALRQGDMVGMQAFGGTDRWLPPVRGVGSMSGLLNHLYDYQTSTEPSDFGEAGERLMHRQLRRSLVVVLTNLRGEDDAELLPALRMLAARHLVVLASLREEAVQQLVRQPVNGFRESLRFGAAEAYMAERRALLRQIEGHGILTVDVPARELPVALANRYLDIKRAARL